MGNLSLQREREGHQSKMHGVWLINWYQNFESAQEGEFRGTRAVGTFQIRA
jgi:hypothetical protein